MTNRLRITDLFSGRGRLETNEMVVETIATESDSLPSKVVVGRDLYLQLGKMYENLFSLLGPEIVDEKDENGEIRKTKKKQEAKVEINKRIKKDEAEKKGKFAVVESKYPIDVSIFPYFVNAVSQNLSNQSYTSGNLIDKKKRLLLRGEKVMHSSKNDQFIGNISLSLRKFICDVYGTYRPNKRQQERVIGLLRALHDTFVSFTDAKGKNITAPLCNFSLTKDGDNAPQILHLSLHPIWSETLKGIGRLPQNINYELTDTLGKRKTPEHMKLINELCVQDVREPVKRNIETLVQVLHLKKYYGKDKKKVEDKIVNLLNDLKEIGYIEKFVCKVVKKNGRNTLSGVLVYLPQK